jgi:putative ABC transport system permease protein
MLVDYVRLAFQNIKRRRLRSWLTLIGVIIGITSVVALIGLGEGLRSTVSSQFGFLGKDIITITASGGFGPPGTGVVDPLTTETLDELRKVYGVKGVAARNLESAKIRFNERLRFQFMGSVPSGKDREVLYDALSLTVGKGRLLEDGDSKQVVVGHSFTQEGMFGKPIRTGKTITIQDTEFEVVGILEKASNTQLNGIVLMNEDPFLELFDRNPDNLDIINVQVREYADIETVDAHIEQELREIRDVEKGEEDFSVQTPDALLEQVNSLLLGIQIFIYLIAGISVLVGGIGIMNTMYTSVLERTKDIGVMKSVGSTNRSIFVMFFIESGGLGLTGGLIGIGLGSAISYGLSVAARQALGSDLVSVQLSPVLLGGALLFSFLIGALFGTLPAIQASRLQPVDALRYTK